MLFFRFVNYFIGDYIRLVEEHHNVIIKRDEAIKFVINAIKQERREQTGALILCLRRCYILTTHRYSTLRALR